MIEIKDLTKQYAKKVTAVDHVTAVFKDKTFYGIMGRSGSGKSTLLQLLGTLAAPTEGTIVAGGEDITRLKPNALADFRQKQIGFVFQDFQLHPYLTALQNVMLPMQLNAGISRREQKEKAMELLRKVSLEHRADHYPKQLSGGEQQRAAIARALANDPRYILADEPTGNLDVQNEQRIFSLLKELSGNKTVIAVTHNPVISQYAGVVLHMQDGRLQGEGMV